MSNKEAFEKFERMESIASEEGWISDFGDDVIFLSLKNELRNGNDNITLKEFIDKIEKEFKNERGE